MIEFERTNEKGDKQKAFTHKAYLSSSYKNQIQRLQSRNQSWTRSTQFGFILLTYWGLHNVPVLKSLVQNKIHWRGKFFIVSAGVGVVASLLTSTILSSSLQRAHTNLLKNQTFPAWLNREKVVNPDRVFYQLDDSHHNELNILHSGITWSSVQNLIPDFIVGTPHKPHYPVAQHHHH